LWLLRTPIAGCLETCLGPQQFGGSRRNDSRLFPRCRCSAIALTGAEIGLCLRAHAQVWAALGTLRSGLRAGASDSCVPTSQACEQQLFECAGALETRMARRQRLLCAACASKASRVLQATHRGRCAMRGITPRYAAVPPAVVAMLCVGSGKPGVADVVRLILRSRLLIKF
jgi:hypothetical protein